MSWHPLYFSYWQHRTRSEGSPWTSTLLATLLSSTSYRMIFIKLELWFKCTRYSRDNLTLIHEQMCSISILFQNNPERYTWKEIFHDNLSLPKSTEICWLERDLNLHFRDTGPPLYLLSHRVPKVRVQIPLDSTFFSWLRQCPIIMKNFCSFLIFQLFQRVASK